MTTMIMSCLLLKKVPSHVHTHVHTYDILYTGPSVRQLSQTLASYAVAAGTQ